MASRSKPPDPILEAADLLRALAEGQPKSYWHLLRNIGQFAAVWAPTARDRARAESLRERCAGQVQAIEATESPEKRAWLRQQTEGPRRREGVMMPSGSSIIVVALLFTVAGCMHYPPRLTPSRGQSAAQQDADARDCDREVHSAGSQLITGMFTAWSEKERDGYTACMQGRGYVVEK